MLQTALHFSHTLLQEIVVAGDTVVDATVGNGHDTVFLAELVGATGHVYGFDIQKQAIDATTKKLTTLGLTSSVKLFQQGHETVAEVIPKTTFIKAAIFNLGYLPKSDKEIITKPTTTKQALERLLDRLMPKGRIILVVYYGHSGGKNELDLIENYCCHLTQETYSVLRYQFTNQKNNPPILFCIEKK